MDPLDKILAAEDRLVPSSGFHLRVMEAVHAEQVRLAPVRFPWGRFAVGVAASVAWAAAGAVVVEQMNVSFAAVSSVSLNRDVGYGLLAIAGSLIVAAIPRLRSIE